MPPEDPYKSHPVTVDSVASNAAAITPSDAADLTVVPRALWVGVPGNLKVTTRGGQVETFPDAHGWMCIRVTRVWATGTTASGIVGVW